VASLDVVVALHADTALHAGTHLGNVILEAAKRFQLAFEDDHVVTQHADRTVAVHHALKDHAARDRTEFRRAEHVAHFGDTQNVLANIAAEHAGQGFLDVLDDVVDHVVVTQIQTFLLDDPACAGVGPHVEAEQHRIGRQRQVGIAFGDTTDAAANDAHLHFIVTQAAERALQGFQRTADIGFEDDIERLLLFLPHALEDVFQLAGVGTGELDLAELALTEQGHFTGLLLVAQHAELVTGLGRTVQAENLHGDRRSGFLDGVAVLVEHRADATVGGTNQSHIALTQRTVLYQYGCYRTAALVETRLNHYTAARRRRRGRELKQFRLQQYRFQQLVDTGTHLRRNRYERRIAAPVFGDHIQRGQAVLDVVGVGLGFVDLVHRNHDRHASGFRMLHGFLGLRHHAIVGRDHQDHDIGRLDRKS